MTTRSCDILVVGAGLIGTALALGLEQQGWQVTLVEAAPADSLLALPQPATGVETFEPRVSALSIASQRLLSGLGAWPPAQADSRHCPYQRMVVWDGEGTGHIEFNAGELHAPALGAIVENSLVVRSLLQAALASNIEVMAGVQVDGWWEDGPRRGISLADGRRVEARLTVAADGANSRLRQWVGLPTREWDYQQQALVCTVQTEQGHQNTAWQRFSATGPLAFLPLSTGSDDSQHFCSIVWSQDTSEAQRLAALDDENFMAELERAFEARLGRIVAVSRRVSFPLRQRHAKDYVRPGLALVGDAAHSIHPLAGQGANLGYSDVRVLLEELARARNDRLSPAHELVLARYQRRRKGENLAMMAAMDGFRSLFGSDELAVRWVRNTGMRWLNSMPALRNRIAAEAMGMHK
ncbi:UbiH/UbiF/VisC/COQ6 family ubiquinone biosynthesis hydroxylase [Marinobacter salicampi]|uniref:UbiH/UbiF/VisC/COQ6 family ubiquinone biosynthesis hydroxylase n=1 Tax=Marinobacter salicampi TaxID=435907 RepID=UPI0014083BB0|nr:UbiH/UbiF/VisC/COQ6 family ubiquinone biosynthesis hydroxylase [Marinobacter salicampi]